MVNEMEIMCAHAHTRTRMRTRMEACMQACLKEWNTQRRPPTHTQGGAEVGQLHQLAAEVPDLPLQPARLRPRLSPPVRPRHRRASQTLTGRGALLRCDTKIGWGEVQIAKLSRLLRSRTARSCSSSRRASPSFSSAASCSARPATCGVGGGVV